MMARMLSLFLLIIFAGQSWGLAVSPGNDSYRYDGRKVTENTQNRDYDVIQKLSGDGVRQTVGALSDKAQEESFFASVDGFVVPNKTTKEVLTRKAPGRDGGISEQIIERDASGNVISRTHKVTTDGKTVHQHQNNVGKEGGVRQFPDEWTGTKTINAPYENISPKFPPDKVPGGRY